MPQKQKSLALAQAGLTGRVRQPVTTRTGRQTAGLPPARSGRAGWTEDALSRRAREDHPRPLVRRQPEVDLGADRPLHSVTGKPSLITLNGGRKKKKTVINPIEIVRVQYGVAIRGGHGLVGQQVWKITKPKLSISLVDQVSLRQSMHRANPYTDKMTARDVRRSTIIDDGPWTFGVTQEEIDSAVGR